MADAVDKKMMHGIQLPKLNVEGSSPFARSIFLVNAALVEIGFVA